MWYIRFYCIFILIIPILSGAVYEDIAAEYFKPENLERCETDWNVYRKAYENSFGKTLQEGAGSSNRMNVYLKRRIDATLLTRGYYHTDNQVNIVLRNLALLRQPFFYDPEISFPLCSNVLKVETGLSRATIVGSYLLFRNKSSIIYNKMDQDPYLTSPFRFEQVRNTGEVTILIDRCILSGVAIAVLAGHSVNLKYNSFRLTNCQVSFEIFTHGSGVPPVIANYLLDGGGGMKMEQFLMEYLKREMLPLLQATMYTHVNSTAIFKDSLHDIRSKQNKVMEASKTYLSNIISQINAMTKQTYVIRLNDFSLSWNDTFTHSKPIEKFTLKNMYVSGLDSAYSAHIGGLYKLSTTKLVELIRINTLQLVGYIELTSGYEGDFAFAVEIHDTTVEMTVNVNGEDKDSPKYKFEVTGWRQIDFSCPEIETLPMESLITGYMVMELPKHIVTYFNDLIDKAASANENDEKKLGLQKELDKNNENEPTETEDNDISEEHPSGKKKRREAPIPQPFKRRYRRNYPRNSQNDDAMMERLKIYEKQFDQIVEEFKRNPNKYFSTPKNS